MLGFEDFAGRVGHTFRLDGPDGPIGLELIECLASGPGGQNHSFSLTFTAGPDVRIEQATYRLGADGVAPVPIFLVPVAAGSADTEPAQLYQAVFNRLPE